jgi:hypothetical protein
MIFTLFVTRNATTINMTITAGMTIFMSKSDPFPIPGPPDPRRKKPPLPPPGNLPPPPVSSRGSPSGVILFSLVSVHSTNTIIYKNTRQTSIRATIATRSSLRFR